jgi:hypothetical protein
MTSGSIMRGSWSLRLQISDMETDIQTRRQSLRAAAAVAWRRLAERIVSPAMLCGAVGIGVAIERVSHHRWVWSFFQALEFVTAGIGLLSSLAPPVIGASDVSAIRRDPGSDAEPTRPTSSTR